MGQGGPAFQAYYRKIVSFIIIKMEYEKYIQSVQWLQKRLEILQRDNYKCKTCASVEDLQIHHITYEHLGNELNDELITLCKDCHLAITDTIRERRFHDRRVDLLKDYKIENNRKINEVNKNGKLEKIELQDYRRSTPART